MTDKQIIIDGVDVSGCKYYKDYTLCCSRTPNCNYKKYKRKEQECEELKKQLKEMNEVIRTETTSCNLVNILKTELDQLKAEVKSKTEYIQEQREIINQYSKEIEMYKKCQGKRASKREEELKAENENWQNEYWKLEQGNDFLAEKNSRLMGCLAEIKEIAETEVNNRMLFADKESFCDFNKILQKISEVENES